MLIGRILPILDKDQQFQACVGYHSYKQTANLLTEKFCAIMLRGDKSASAEAMAFIAHDSNKKSKPKEKNSGKSARRAKRTKHISFQQVQASRSWGCWVSGKPAACRKTPMRSYRTQWVRQQSSVWMRTGATATTVQYGTLRREKKKQHFVWYACLARKMCLCKHMVKVR